MPSHAAPTASRAAPTMRMFHEIDASGGGGSAIMIAPAPAITAARGEKTLARTMSTAKTPQPTAKQSAATVLATMSAPGYSASLALSSASGAYTRSLGA